MLFRLDNKSDLQCLKENDLPLLSLPLTGVLAKIPVKAVITGRRGVLPEQEALIDDESQLNDGKIRSVMQMQVDAGLAEHANRTVLSPCEKGIEQRGERNGERKSGEKE